MFRQPVLLAAAGISVVLSAPSAFSQNAIATADGESAGTRIEITELSRSSGGTVTMKFRLVNDSGENASPYELMGNYYHVGAVHLIDASGKKKYLVITDSGGTCVCSNNLTTKLEPGKSINLWARFPAPPAEVKEVSVIFPHFIPTDAPISE